MWFFRSHRNFAKLFGFTTAPPTIVMKHYQRGSLSDLIYHDAQNILWKSHILYTLLKDIAIALKEMHDAGFVHCDIKVRLQTLLKPFDLDSLAIYLSMRTIQEFTLY